MVRPMRIRGAGRWLAISGENDPNRLSMYGLRIADLGGGAGRGCP